MLLLIGDLLLTSVAKDVRPTEFFKLTATALPYTDLKTDIFNTGVNV